MTALFVDTSGWFALANGADPVHAASRSARDAHLTRGGILISTDFVMDETLTLLRVRLGIEAAERWWDLVSRSPRVVWEPIDAGRAQSARAWFFRWRDKEFSFTDCTSFVVMKELRIRRALTTDRHFAQAGFLRAPAR